MSNTLLFIKEEGSPTEKVVIADDILEDLPRLVFIDEDCGNYKVFIDGGELTRNINKKKKYNVLEAYRRTIRDK